MRVAPTFMRFGSFEIFLDKELGMGREGPSVGLQDQMMPGMLDYLIKNFYPDIQAKYGDSASAF